VVTKAVIGVPSDYDRNQCHALEKAGELCRIKVQLVREPELAVRAYGLKAGSTLEERASGRSASLAAPVLDPTALDEGERYILVVDIGGGTFDVCMVRELTHLGDIHICFTSGDARLGGDDFDEDLMKWALKEMEDHLRSPEVKGWPMSRENKRRLQLVCRRAKEKLSSSESAMIDFAGTVVVVTRDQFNVLAFKTLERLLVPVRKCCMGAGVGLPYERIATETFKEVDRMRSTSKKNKKKNMSESSLNARVKSIRQKYQNANDGSESLTGKANRRKKKMMKGADKEDDEDEDEFSARLDEVLCIGAASWMPSVRETLALITGIEPSVCTVDPDTAVAVGAAAYAAVLDAKMPDTQVQTGWRVAWAEFLAKRPDMMERIRKEHEGRQGGAGGGASDVPTMELEPVPSQL